MELPGAGLHEDHRVERRIPRAVEDRGVPGGERQRQDQAEPDGELLGIEKATLDGDADVAEPRVAVVVRVPGDWPVGLLHHRQRDGDRDADVHVAQAERGLQVHREQVSHQRALEGPATVALAVQHQRAVGVVEVQPERRVPQLEGPGGLHLQPAEAVERRMVALHVHVPAAGLQIVLRSSRTGQDRQQRGEENHGAQVGSANHEHSPWVPFQRPATSSATARLSPPSVPKWWGLRGGLTGPASRPAPPLARGLWLTNLVTWSRNVTGGGGYQAMYLVFLGFLPNMGWHPNCKICDGDLPS